MKPYPEYKHSGVEWLGEIPEYWSMKDLKYLLKDGKEGIKIGPFGSALKLDIVTNKGYKIYGQENVIKDDFSLGYKYIDEDKFEEMAVYEIVPGDVNWFTPSDFHDDLILNNSKRKITSKALTDRVAKIFPSKSVFLIGIGATLGKIGLIEKQSSCNQQINPIIFKDKFNPFYGAYFLKSYGPIIISLANSSTLAILNQAQTKDLLVLQPPLEEQNIIVKHIEKETTRIDSIISKSEKEIALLQEYRTALISEVVTGKIDVREEKI